MCVRVCVRVGDGGGDGVMVGWFEGGREVCEEGEGVYELRVGSNLDGEGGREWEGEGGEGVDRRRLSAQVAVAVAGGSTIPFSCPTHPRILPNNTCTSPRPPITFT
jgi:hypothetical protein